MVKARGGSALPFAALRFAALGLAAVVSLAPSAVASATPPAQASGTGSSAGPGAGPGGDVRAAGDVADAEGVVLIGTPALDWHDVRPEDTPQLARIVAGNAVASLTVRSVRPRTCVVDGWLTISAGRRSADIPADHCRPPADPTAAAAATPAAAGAPFAAAVPGWAELVAAQDYGYGSEPGLLGDALAAADACATAVGPGAALALATSAGEVPRYARAATLHEPTGAGALMALAADCPLTVVDAGSLALPAFDTLVGDVLDLLPPGYLLLVAGIADAGPTPPPAEGASATIPPAGLRVAMMAGDGVGPRWLTASSTRWTGLVQLTDLTPTLLAGAGVDDLPARLVGTPWRPSDAAHPATPDATLGELRALDRAAQIFRTQSAPFFRCLGFGQLAVYAVALLVLAARPRGRVRRVTLRSVYAVALVAATLPVASFLANLTRWWHLPRPDVALWTAVLGTAAALAALAAVGPWRRRLYGPPAAIAGLTAIALAVDVFFGSHLQHASLLGLSPLVAGRFYGLGNIPFAVFAVAVLVLAAAAAQWIADRGGTRRTALIAVLAIGGIGVLVDGAPAGGADFGGVLALLPGVGVLAVGVAGRRLSAVRALAIGVAAVAAVSAIAVLDWLRAPASRSHLGDFVGDVLDGTAGDTIGRKFGSAFGSLDTSLYGWLVPAAVVVVALMTASPQRWRARGLADAIERWPALRPLIYASLVTGVVGFLVNDSGIIVPAIVFTAGIPLVVTAVVRARLDADGPGHGSAPTTPSAQPAARP